MAVKDRVVSLVLRAKNAISKNAEPATDSLRELSQETDSLQQELRDLDRQQQAAQALEGAKIQAAQATKALETTVSAYERLKTNGRAAGQSQADYAVQVKKARTAQSIANSEYRKSQKAVAKYSGTLRRAGLDTKDLAGSQDRVEKEIRETQTRLRSATGELRKHSAQLKSTAGEGGRFGNALSGLKGKLLGLVAGVGVFRSLRAGITKLITASSDLEQIEQGFIGVYGSAEKGKEVLAEVDRIAERNALSLDETARAARQLKVAGIDPLNGSLQSVIDANVRFGRGTQTLNTLITQLGQGWQAGRLQLEELNSITDSGIPIMRALGTITGRSGAEIREMASAGELGRESIKKLLDELGSMAEGAGAKNINTFRGLVTALKKEVTDFFALAGESGALDSLKNEFRTLLDTLRTASEDGSIRVWAAQVSDAFSGLVTTVKAGGASIAIAVKGVQAGFRTLAAAVLGSMGQIADNWGALIGMFGDNRISIALKQFADNAKGAAGDLVDQVADDSQAMLRYYEMAFGGAGESAKSGMDAAAKATEQATQKIKADLETASDAVVSLAQSWSDSSKLLKPANLQLLEGALEKLNQKLEASGQTATEWATKFKTERSQEHVDQLRLAIQEMEAQGVAVPKNIAGAFSALESSTAGAATAARSELGSALKELNLDLGSLTGGFSEVEREAVQTFQSVAANIADAGLEAEQSANVVLSAFREAFAAVESEGAKTQLIEELDAALQSNILTQKEYAAVLAEVSEATNEALDSNRRGAEIYAETTEKALSGEQQKQAASRRTAGAYNDQGDAAEQAGNKAEAGTQTVASAASILISIFRDIRDGFYDTGEGAGQLFDRLYQEQTRYAVMSTRSWLETLNQVEEVVQKRVEGAERLFSEVMGRQGEDLYRFVRSAESAKGAVSLLDKQKLETLNRSIESARQRMQSLEDSASSTAQSLQTELVRMTGTKEEILRREFEQRLAGLQDQYDQASEQGARGAKRQYAKAKETARKIYDQQLKELREEQKAEREQARENERLDALSQKKKRQQSPAPEPAAPSAGSAAPEQVVNINLPDGRASRLAGDAESVEALLDTLNEAGMKTVQ